MQVGGKVQAPETGLQEKMKVSPTTSAVMMMNPRSEYIIILLRLS
jgi:hypothetical protein